MPAYSKFPKLNGCCSTWIRVVPRTRTPSIQPIACKPLCRSAGTPRKRNVGAAAHGPHGPHGDPPRRERLIRGLQRRGPPGQSPNRQPRPDRHYPVEERGPRLPLPQVAGPTWESRAMPPGYQTSVRALRITAPTLHPGKAMALLGATASRLPRFAMLRSRRTFYMGFATTNASKT